MIRFGPTPILTAVTTKWIGVASSHNSFLGNTELALTNWKSPLTAASTYNIINVMKIKKYVNHKHSVS